MALTKTPGGLVQPLPGRIPPYANYIDPEGSPDRRGVRRHGGTDWFAAAGSILFAPETGKVVDVQASKGSSGQVFGGVVKIQARDGRVWVFRHVDPGQRLRVGQNISAGTPIARITRWNDNPSGSHLHMELWRSLAGGYRQENLIDPSTFLRTGRAGQPSGNIFDADENRRGGVDAETNLVPGRAGRAVDAVGGVVDAASAIPNAIGWVADNWDRVLEVVGGGVLLLVGLFLLAKQGSVPIPLPSRAARAE